MISSNLSCNLFLRYYDQLVHFDKEINANLYRHSFQEYSKRFHCLYEWHLTPHMTLPIETCIRRTPCIKRTLQHTILMRCRQREPAKLAIRIERFFNSIFNVKKIFVYSATIICWICGFCRRFFPFFHDYILLSAAKISSCNILSFLFTFFFVPIRQYLKPLKGRN